MMFANLWRKFSTPKGKEVHRRRSPVRRHHRGPVLEALEQRLTPSCFARIDNSLAGPYLNVSCDAPGNTIDLDHSGSTTMVWINIAYSSFSDSSFGYAAVSSSGGGSTVNLFRTGRTVDVTGGGSVTVNLGYYGTVQGILNGVIITNPVSHNAVVNVYDYADTSFRTPAITTEGGSYNYEDITGLAPATISLQPGDITTAYVDTGTAGATVNVQKTNVNTYLTGNSSNTAVNVGTGGSVQGLLGDLDIYDSTGTEAVTLDDSSDTVGRSVYQTTNGNPGFGQITGLAPHPIFYWYASTSGITLDTGHGGTTVNVQTTVTPFSVISDDTTTVNLGLSGSVQSIQGAVTIYNGPSYDVVNIYDTPDTGNRTVAIGSGGITGLAPAALNFSSFSVSTLTVSGGSGTIRYTVAATPARTALTLNTGSGTDTVNVQATTVPLAVNGNGGAGDDVVNLGFNNSLAGLAGAMTIYNGPSYFHVNVNDSADSASHANVILSSSSLAGLAPSALNFSAASVNTLTVNGGSGANTYTISGSPANLGTTLNTGSGTDTVYVQATPYPLSIVGSGGGGNDVVNLGLNNSLAGLTGAVTLTNSSFFQVNINDAADTGNRTVTVGSGGITGLAPAALNFTASAVNTLTVNGGSGSNSYTVAATPAHTALTLNTGSGTDAVNVQATTVPVTVNGNGGAGSDVVNVGLGNSLAGLGGAVTLTNPSFFQVNLNDSADTTNLPNVVIGAGGITGLAPRAINFTASSVSALTVNGGTGNSTYTVAATPAHTALTLNTGSGTDTVNVQATTVPLAVNGSGGGGNDVANLGGLDYTVSSLLGAVTLANSPSSFHVNVNNAGDESAHSVVLSSSSLTGFGLAVLNFASSSVSTLTIAGGNSGVFTSHYTITGSPASQGVTLRTGGADTVDVQATPYALAIYGGPAYGRGAVNLGLNNSLSGLTGAVTLAVSSFQVNVNDSADPTNHPNVVIGAGGITGLAPAAINFTTLSASGLTINGGTGSSGYTITDTPAGATGGLTLNTGLGGNTVNVQRTAAPLTVNTGSNDAVNISGPGNTLDPIGAVTVHDPTGTCTVTVNDSGYSGTEDYGVTNARVTIGRSSTFALTYNGIGALTLNGGPGGNYFDIDSTSVSTTVNAGAGGNILHISPFTQYLAASIVGHLTLNGGGSDILEFSDANDPNSETFTFDSAPMSLTLGSTGSDITDFFGMGGGVYVTTNGFSTPDDQSGTVIFDPDGGPPTVAGNGPSAGDGLARRFSAAAPTQAVAAGDVTFAAHAMVTTPPDRAVGAATDQVDLIDQLFSL